MSVQSTPRFTPHSCVFILPTFYKNTFYLFTMVLRHILTQIYTMALPEVADALQALSISNPEYLLFCPSSENAWLREKFDDIPRYLFRVFTPNSRGTADESWTRSMDATDAAQNSRVDRFARENKRRVASMLNRHLQWWKGHEDNLVSWTSSLLFAPVYIFHLHANSNDRSAFDDLYLCIIDTNKFF